MDQDYYLTVGIAIGMAAMWLIQRLLRLRRRASAPAAVAAPVVPPEIKTERRRHEDEIEALHERLAVLERIATDPAERTARAIESLR